MAKRYYNPVQLLGSVIFRLKSKKGNIYFKLVSKSYNTITGEILEGDALINENQAVSLSKSLSIDIKDLATRQDAEEMTYQEYLDQEAELEKELAAKEAEKNEV